MIIWISQSHTIVLSCTGKDSGTELEDSVFTPVRGPVVNKSQYDDLMSEYIKLADAMSVIKKDLSQLQDLVSWFSCFNNALMLFVRDSLRNKDMFLMREYLSLALPFNCN